MFTVATNNRLDSLASSVTILQSSSQITIASVVSAGCVVVVTWPLDYNRD